MFKTIFLGVVGLLILSGCGGVKIEPYEKLGAETLDAGESLYYLIAPSDRVRTNLEKIAQEIGEQECEEKRCSISFYDDKRAYELFQERRKLEYKNQISAWNKENYIFVADHRAGFAGFDGRVSLYDPSKDRVYQELAGAAGGEQ